MSVNIGSHRREEGKRGRKGLKKKGEEIGEKGEEDYGHQSPPICWSLCSSDLHVTPSLLFTSKS